MDLAHYIFLKVHRETDWADLNAIDVALMSFNIVEAVIWFFCAFYIIRRNLANHHSMLEYVYGILFILFGASDLVESYQLSSPLIWAKLLILISLFTVRHKVIHSYEPKPPLI